ncbi:hypothetical protein LQZ19_00230 [Treponema primitia]|uniref:hypothetical protein n=1 Tax=Treponema primitia TaxID=88058 RepID=UPI0039800CDA
MKTPSLSPQKFCIVTLLFLGAAVLSHTQTAAELERVLGLKTVSCEDAAWFILSATAALPPDSSPAEAYNFARENKWLPKKTRAEGAITFGGVSLLIMKSLSLKGGLMYTLFPGPRYSYRELSRLQILQGRSYSTAQISGETLLRILSRALDYENEL